MRDLDRLPPERSGPGRLRPLDHDLGGLHDRHRGVDAAKLQGAHRIGSDDGRQALIADPQPDLREKTIDADLVHETAQPADRRTAGTGRTVTTAVTNRCFGTIPRSSSLGNPTIPIAQLMKLYPQYTTVSLYRNNVGTTIYNGFYAKLEQRFTHGPSYLVSYTRSTRHSTGAEVQLLGIMRG